MITNSAEGGVREATAARASSCWMNAKGAFTVSERASVINTQASNTLWI